MTAPRLLAFDTSTDTLSVAVGLGSQVLAEHTAAGGAQASVALIPAIRALLAQAGWQLHELDAIVFGRGPGAFTGVRTACSVAQGLAFAAQVPVLPLDTLAAVAQTGLDTARATGHAPTHVGALLDARMDEIYVAGYRVDGDALHLQNAPRLSRPEELAHALDVAPGWWLAGNAGAVYGGRFPAALAALPQHPTVPTARALLCLAPAALAAGAAVDAALAQPLYVRDKVALTTAERAAAAAGAAA